MLELKAGVRVFGLRPELLLALQVAEGLWGEHGPATLVVTAVMDGTHKRQSLHYSGLAVDLRLHAVAAEKRAGLVQRLQAALGPDYVVLHEAIGQRREHCHVHFLPAEAY